MPNEISLGAAFLVGLLSSIHCIGMCGGIVGALTLGIRAPGRTMGSIAPYLLAYNTGRIASYAVAGAIVGFLSVPLLQLAPRFVARLISAAFMVALGLYLTGWWTGLALLERLGGNLWTRIAPLGRRLLPVRHPLQALLLGLLWGWLQCGLVYATLAWSLAAGGATESAALMTAFGLGTLPMLLIMGATARWFGGIARQAWVRRVVGLLLIALGIYALLNGTYLTRLCY
ncbi:MAG: sulfite exporter TauE/SafE family protein [Gammaproteobacteria bacterium]|nr:sulfite exporter TauE/SafE family protein [Gammaproteobacteria bacterium]